MKPPLPLTDPKFKYVNAAETDLRATFRRIRKEQRAQAEERAQVVRSIEQARRR